MIGDRLPLALAAVELALYAQADWNDLEDRLEICKMAQDLGAPRLLDSLVELVVELVPEIESSSVLVSVFKFLLSIDNDSHLLGTLDNLHNIKIKKELVPLTLAEVSKLLDGVEDKIFLVKTIKLAKRWAYNQPAEKTKCLEVILSKLNRKSVRLVKEFLRDSK